MSNQLVTSKPLRSGAGESPALRPLCTIPLHVGIGYGIGFGISFLHGFGGGGFLILVPIVVFALGVPVFVIYMRDHRSKKQFRKRRAR